MSTKQNIKERISRVLMESLELDLTHEAFEDGAQLDELFSLDSVAAIEFIVGLEKEFQIVLDPEALDLEMLKDMDRLATHIASFLK